VNDYDLINQINIKEKIKELEKNLQMVDEEYNFSKDPFWKIQKEHYQNQLNKELEKLEELKPKPKLKPFQEIFKEGLLDDTTPQFKSRSKIVNMSIDDFLKLAAPLEKEFSNRARDSFQQGIRWSDLPFLQFDSDEHDPDTQKVYGHEGRHRARVLKELGYTEMPVEMRSRDIRWSEQANPKSYDYIEKFPKYLMQEGENRMRRIPFPFTREEAPLAYKLNDDDMYKKFVETAEKPSVVGKVAKGLGKLGSRIVPGLGQILTVKDMYDFFANPMVVEAPTIERPKPKPEMFIEPDAIQKDKLYNSYLNSRNRMG
jgi:hypothetical protein